MAPRPTAALLACSATVVLALSGCSDSDDGPPSAAVVSAPVPGVTLPPHPLRELVPTPAEAPPGMTPLLTATGPRDLAAIAAFSKDSGTAATALREHGFRDAYVAQYAHPSDGRVLSVVAVQFATVKGATDDLTADLQGSSGKEVQAAPVGDQFRATTQPLPDGGGELLTLRFRSGATTWLVAYGGRTAPDPAVAVRLAESLVARAAT